MAQASVGRRCSWYAPQGVDPEEDPGHAGVTVLLGWPGNALDPPGRARGSVRGEASLGDTAQKAASVTRPWISGRRWMDGFMCVFFLVI